MGVLEVACFGFKEGINATDETTTEGCLLRDIFARALKQPGARSAYWAHEIEDPKHLWGFMEWDSLDDHVKWQEHPDNAKAMQQLSPYIDVSAGPGFIKHADVEPFPVSVFDNAPVVEVMGAYFPADITDADKAKVGAIFKEFAVKLLLKSPDFKGASTGWGLETDFPLPGDGGSSGHAVRWAFIGWPSVEAHRKVSETDGFKDYSEALKNMPGLVKVSMVHLSCKSLKPDNRPAL